MDSKAIEADIKNYKIREGPLYKRSKFLKEWRERWIVLTSNFMYTFANKNLEQVTDIIDLKEIKSYKSYLRKDQQMIPPGFKIRSADDMYYFCAKNCNEKWSWLVSLERLMDYKYVGASNYNNADWIKTKGFDSQIQFDTGAKVNPTQASPLQKQKTSEEAKKNVDDQADQILKKLQEQQKQLEKKKEELEKKQATFLLEQKKAQQDKVKKQQEQRKQQALKKEQPKKQEPKKEEVKKQQKKPQPKPEQSPKKTVSGDGPSVSQLRSMYENKMTEKQTAPKYDTSKYQAKKTEKKQDDINIYRGKVVTSLFQEFRKQAAFTYGLKHVTDFLVNVCADEKSGYSSFVIIEGKTNPNRKNFSQIFIQLLNVFNEYNKCENLMKFIEICIFSIPGLFDAQQTAIVQRKLKEIFNNVNDEQKLALIIKNMFIMNKLCKYEKKDNIAPKLDKLVKQSKKQQCRNWAKKLYDQL